MSGNDHYFTIEVQNEPSEKFSVMLARTSLGGGSGGPFSAGPKSRHFFQHSAFFN
jgi:hypothetical protein